MPQSSVSAAGMWLKQQQSRAGLDVAVWGDVCPSCPFHLPLLEPGTAVAVPCPCGSLHRSSGRVGSEGQGKSPWHSCHHNSLQCPAAGHSRAQRGPGGDQCRVHRAGGDKGSPNLRLPALTESLIIFKFGE